MPELVSDLYNQSGSKRKPGDDVGFFRISVSRCSNRPLECS
jgi:hypothetical protein